MPTSTDVTNLKINQLTEAQYDTAVQGGVIGANEISILTDAEVGQTIQVDLLPTASADELGNIYQFTGTTDANYTNGYFYKCVSDGAVTPTYSWSRVDVQPQGDSLPSQSGNAGKFLTTDGTDASWGNTIEGQDLTLFAKGVYASNKLIFAYSTSSSGSISNPTGYIKAYCERVYEDYLPSTDRNWDRLCLVGPNNVNRTILKVGIVTPANNNYSTIGTPLNQYTRWKNVYTQKINAGNGAGDIILPTTGGTMVVADYTSATQGQVLTLDGNLNATWATPSGGGLPSQTGNAGKFLTTDGTDASWATINALQNTATYPTTSLTILGNPSTTDEINTNVGYNTSCINARLSVAIGAHSTVEGSSSSSMAWNATAIGCDCLAQRSGGIAIGSMAKSYNDNAIAINGTASGDAAIMIGKGTNSEAKTFCVGWPKTGGIGNDVYKVVDTDGTIPTDRFTTTPSTDGTYVPTLTISSGVVTRSWAAPGGGGSVPTLTWYTVSTAGSTLTIADTSSAQLVKIYKNGLLLEPTADYSISGTTLTMVTALVVGDKITTEVF